jgi:uncharacterized membrane protein YbhN (UPF0104 family)
VKARIGFAALSACGVLFMLFVELPRISGVGWEDTTDRIGALTSLDLCALVAVWAAGIAAHTLVLRSALPGLSSRQAWALNLGGSGVSNVIPFGGAAGIGLNYAMLRSWGYDRAQIVVFTLLTNTVVTVVKAAIVVVGLAILLHTGLAWQIGPADIHRLVVGVLVAGLGIALVSATRATIRRKVYDAAKWLWSCCRATRWPSWRLMALGGITYPVLQGLMFAMCLNVVSAHATLTALVAGYAIERLCTLLPFTPGGAGVAETAATATLVAFGVAAPAAVAGVVLFRIFSYLIEIPLGGLVAAGWFAQRTRQRRLQS